MYFDKDFSFPTGYRFLLTDVVDFLAKLDSYAPKQGARLLDIGCGKKPYKKLFSRWDYRGMDYYSEISNPDVEGSILDIPFPDCSMDGAMTVWVLDDLEEPSHGIKEIARVLKPGGYYFAVENQSANRHFPPHDFFRFTPYALQYLGKKHGLELLSFCTFGGDFCLVGFALISIVRKVLFKLRLHKLLGWLFYLGINLVFKPLDRLARLSCFHGQFETNALGYCYVFKKVAGTSSSP